MTVQKSHAPQHLQFTRLAGILFLTLLLFSTGCAPKVVIQSPVTAPPVELAVPKPTVTDILQAQFQAWKGVPHRLGGSSRQGVDCSGLMQVVFREAFQMELPRTSREQSRLGQKVDAREMRPGDLVYFIDKAGDHIGVVVQNRVFLHTSTTQGVMLSELDAYWWPRLRRVQRVLS